MLIKRRERFVEFDIADRFAGKLPPIVVQMAFGLFCFVTAILARMGVDAVFTAAGPFSLIYPTILISTLYGRWPSGVTTFILAFFHAWYVVLPLHYSFSFEVSGDGARTIVNGCAALFILLFAEIFRRGIRQATLERDRHIRTTTTLIRELEHRTKNNFAIVSGLLNMQGRSHKSLEVKEALEIASSRVNSFAAIHDSIYSSGDVQEEIDIADYLKTLCENIRIAFASNSNIEIILSAKSFRMERDKAVSLGLILNEVVTNAVKHAFSDIDKGKIHISFQSHETPPWRLTISDNGCGMKTTDNTPDTTKGGLGTRLTKTFARNADAEIHIQSSESGTIFTLTENTEIAE